MTEGIELSLRAFAELLVLPGYEQERILHDQKYPRQGPARFRVPYYRPALGAIRKYFREGNADAVLGAALEELGSAIGGREAKARQNAEVIKGFRRGQLARRKLSPVPNAVVRAELNGIVLRASPDLLCTEGAGSGLLALYLNCRAGEQDPDVAKYTVELSGWAFEEAGNTFVRGSEYVDIRANKRHRQNTRRARTMSRAVATARVVRAIWPAL